MNCIIFVINRLFITTVRKINKQFKTLYNPDNEDHYSKYWVVFLFATKTQTCLPCLLAGRRPGRFVF